MKVRFEVIIESDVLGVEPEIKIIYPKNGIDSTVQWSRLELPRYDFKKEFKEITLVGDDYRFFREIELSNDRCDRYQLQIVVSSLGIEDYNIFEGYFSMSDGDWDLDLCTVKFDISEVDPYECIDNDDEDANMLTFVLPQEVNTNLTYEFEEFLCIDDDCPDHSSLLADYWVLWYILGSGKSYLREVLYCPCDYIPDDSWHLLEDCSNGVKKFARSYDYIAFEQTYLSGGTSYFSLDTDLEPRSSIDNGRRLKQVLESLLVRSCFGVNITLVSDFFQWNPENVTVINYITNEINDYTNLILFQKSDVKRPDSSNNATVANVNFKDLLEKICKMFNCGYKIINKTLRVEHISWFENDLGINLLAIDKDGLLNGTKKYSYDKTKLPQKEVFEFMESRGLDFKGKDIIYDSTCVNNNIENKSEIIIEDITTDVMYCIENSSAENNNVSDDGLVLIACDSNNNIIYKYGILENNTTINNVLSWAHLHDKLFRHGRVLIEGNMNGTDQTFLSTVPTIKQNKFNAKIGYKHMSVFNPIDKIRGALGYGYIQTAEFKLSQCVMSLELLLDTIDLTQVDQTFGDFDGNFTEDFD